MESSVEPHRGLSQTPAAILVFCGPVTAFNAFNGIQQGLDAAEILLILKYAGIRFAGLLRLSGHLPRFVAVHFYIF